MPFSEVLLVRHGESQANRAGRFARDTWDPHLTEVGRHQAQALLRQLHNASIQYLATSPLKRAQETIQPLAEKLGILPTVLPDLSEVNLGEWDGQRLDDLKMEKNTDFSAWIQDPDRFPPPGGERISAVGQRVLHTLTEFVRSRPPGLTVAATHADCIKAALLAVTKADGPASRSIMVPNGGQLRLRHYDNGKWFVVLSPLTTGPE